MSDVYTWDPHPKMDFHSDALIYHWICTCTIPYPCPTQFKTLQQQGSLTTQHHPTQKHKPPNTNNVPTQIHFHHLPLSNTSLSHLSPNLHFPLTNYCWPQSVETQWNEWCSNHKEGLYQNHWRVFDGTWVDGFREQ